MAWSDLRRLSSISPRRQRSPLARWSLRGTEANTCALGPGRQRCGGADINVYAGRPQELSSYPPVESVRQMTSFSSVTITATESMSMKRASSGLTSVR